MVVYAFYISIHRPRANIYIIFSFPPAKPPTLPPYQYCSQMPCPSKTAFAPFAFLHNHRTRIHLHPLIHHFLIPPSPPSLPPHFPPLSISTIPSLPPPPIQIQPNPPKNNHDTTSKRFFETIESRCLYTRMLWCIGIEDVSTSLEVALLMHEWKEPLGA